MTITNNRVLGELKERHELRALHPAVDLAAVAWLDTGLAGARRPSGLRIHKHNLALAARWVPAAAPAYVRIGTLPDALVLVFSATRQPGAVKRRRDGLSFGGRTLVTTLAGLGWTQGDYAVELRGDVLLVTKAAA